VLVLRAPKIIDRVAKKFVEIRIKALNKIDKVEINSFDVNQRSC
jgi:hypothetical protein